MIGPVWLFMFISSSPGIPAQRKWAVCVSVRKEGGERNRLHQKVTQVSCVQGKGHTARDEAEFGGRLEKVGPKGERPAGRFKSSEGIEEGSVRPAPVGAKRGTGFKRIKRRALED